MTTRQNLERSYRLGVLHGKVIAFSEIGLTSRQISHRLQNALSYSGVARILRRHNLGRLALPVHTGRPRKSTPRANRLLVRLAHRHHLASARHLLNYWAERVSVFTVYRRLREAGLRRYRMLKRPMLTAANKIQRLQWAQTRVLWRDPMWDRVVWSDESRFCLHVSDGRQRVWREVGQRFDNRFVIERLQGNGGSIHVWGAIWTDGRSRLQVMRVNVTGEVYAGVLQQFLNTSNPPLNYRFQDDNAPAHRSRRVSNFKEQSGIVSLPWPSRSPDLNPVEHMWDAMSRRVHEQQILNLRELELRLNQAWDEIPQEFIVNLIHSMTRRLGAVIAAVGGHTRY